MKTGFEQAYTTRAFQVVTRQNLAVNSVCLDSVF